MAEPVVSISRLISALYGGSIPLAPYGYTQRTHVPLGPNDWATGTTYYCPGYVASANNEFLKEIWITVYEVPAGTGGTLDITIVPVTGDDREIVIDFDMTALSSLTPVDILATYTGDPRDLILQRGDLIECVPTTGGTTSGEGVALHIVTICPEE